MFKMSLVSAFALSLMTISTEATNSAEEFESLIAYTNCSCSSNHASPDGTCKKTCTCNTGVVCEWTDTSNCGKNWPAPGVTCKDVNGFQRCTDSNGNVICDNTPAP